jgi:YesN/AraC family two-component response regulator
LFDPFSLRSFVNQMTILSFLIYLVASALMLFDRPNQNVPGLKKLKTFWLLFLVAIILLIVVKVVFGNDLGDHLVAAYMAITIYVTDFVVIKRFVEEKATSSRYEKSSLSEEQKELLKQKIVHVFGNEEYFLRDNASLGELSKKVDSTPHYVSQVINEKLGKSFFELLASSRIDKACTLLKQDRNQKIEQVAFDVGYNSKSACNKKFKELKGVTPTEYRELYVDK